MNPVPTDSLRAVLDSVFAAPAYQWVEPPRPFAFLGRWWQALGDWLAGFREGNPQLFEVFFWTLVLILVLVLVHASYVMFQTIRAAGTQRSRVFRDRWIIAMRCGTDVGRSSWRRRDGFSRRCPLIFSP